MLSKLELQSLIPEDPSSVENPPSLEIDHFPSVLGRAHECDYRIPNPLVSRRHCSFVKHDDEIWVCDLGSRNGTRLNGEVVEKEKIIHEGDRIDIGYLPYRVHVPVASRVANFLQAVKEGRKSL